MTRSTFAGILLSGGLAALPFAAQAQVFKCPQKDGTTSFQSSPCAGSHKAASAPVFNPPAPRSSAHEDPYAQPADSGQRASLVLPQHTPAPPQPNAPVAQARQPRQESPSTGGMTEHRMSQDLALQSRNLAAREQQLAAEKRAGNCQQASNNLGVLKEARPVYHYDQQGNKQYVADDARAREIDTAQRQVAENCH